MRGRWWRACDTAVDDPKLRRRRARADGVPYHARTRWPPGFTPPAGGAA